jgi:ATP-dependent DNA ligase
MRSMTELRAECDVAGIEWTDDLGRVQLMDLLREKLGAFDATTELDPMKSRDLKSEIDWTKSVEEGRYDRIGAYLKEGWFCEPKLDGCRMRMFLGLTANSMNTGRRSVKTYQYQNRTHNFPHLRDATVPSLAGTVLDGEICANANVAAGESLLNESVALCNSSPERAQWTQASAGPASYYVFDVMILNGEDITHWSYVQRREALVKVVELLRLTHPDSQIQLVESLPATVENIEHCFAAGFEGAMLKSGTGKYRFGKRAPEWQKVKGFTSGDFFITGYEPGNGGFSGLVGSIEFGYYGEDGEVVNAGKFGNLELVQRQEMTAADGSLHRCWYGTVVEVQAQARTKTNRLRHAHVMRFRPDKDAMDCNSDQINLFPKA